MSGFKILSASATRARALKRARYAETAARGLPVGREHDANSYLGWGCRCRICTEAFAAYQRKAVERRQSVVVLYAPKWEMDIIRAAFRSEGEVATGSLGANPPDLGVEPVASPPAGALAPGPSMPLDQPAGGQPQHQNSPRSEPESPSRA